MSMMKFQSNDQFNPEERKSSVFKDTISKFQDFFGGLGTPTERNPLQEINLFEENNKQEFEDLPMPRKTLTIIFQKEKRPSVSD